MKVRRWLVAASLVSPWVAIAGIDNITPGELARISEFCPDTQTFNTVGFPENPTPAQRRWIGMMGKTFWAVHHYCWAQIAANRAEQAGTTKQARDALLESAVSDIRYVLRNSTPDFVLLPELYTRMGDYYLRMNRPIDAMPVFEQAIASKPDYWPPYVRMANLLARLGRSAQAVDLLQDGLKKMPEQPQLIEALQAIKVPKSAGTKPTAATGARRAPEIN